MHVFLFGAGYSAKAFATRIKGEAVTITGTTRHADKFAALEVCGISPFLFDGKAITYDFIRASRYKKACIFQIPTF